MSGITKFHNPQYDGGAPDLPLAIGDRYYGQDMMRDFLHLKEKSGEAAYNISNSRILEGLIPVKNTNTTIDISLGIAIFKASVKIPDASGASPPPTTSSVDMDAI
ncbi:unnamed protein product, partial [marine sediment metagenome]